MSRWTCYSFTGKQKRIFITAYELKLLEVQGWKRKNKEVQRNNESF